MHISFKKLLHEFHSTQMFSPFLKLKKIYDNPRSYFRILIITFPREKKNEIKPGVFYLYGLEVIIIS